MKTIYLLTDYKNAFGSKYMAVPYRSGMRKELIQNYFKEYGLDVIYLHYSNVNFRDNSLRNQIILYTSSEDNGEFYKSYIEDICYGLTLKGAFLIPNIVYLKAHNNKVFMEILRDLFDIQSLKNVRSSHFGTIEEFNQSNINITEKTIIKTASGAMSRGVSSGNNLKEVTHEASKLIRTRFLIDEWHDFIRFIRHKGYVLNSKHRRKFILQNFIPNLTNDWKILIFDKKYYVLYREVRENDFRASGSGKFFFKMQIPNPILDFAESVFISLNVPNLSLDIGFDGKECYLFEFQAVSFGSTTIEKSPHYFIKKNEKWEIVKKRSELEREYVYSVYRFIKDKKYELTFAFNNKKSN